jgi:hypothetical protein
MNSHDWMLKRRLMMTYDKHGNLIPLTDEEWARERGADWSLVNTEMRPPVVGAPKELSVEFSVMLDKARMNYRLRIENGWLKDATMTREDMIELLT